ncbi:MAG: hypothetical protein ACRENX_02325 [Candidatus Dormibacteria bacterium]
MPGMEPLGSITSGDFYLYLVLDLAITAGLVWLALSWKLGLPVASAPGRGADRPLASAARLRLRRGLGLLWILDGLLQAQPLMATRFASLVIAPVVHGQPGWLAQLLHLEIRLWQARPLDLAATSVLVQLGIGVAILAGGDSRLGRIGLWLSLGWALVVWVGGEAMGGILATGASEVTGAPGAVLLYATAATLLLIPGRYWVHGILPRAIRRGAGLFFLLGALLQALPWEGFWARGGLRASFLPMARMPEPHWVVAPIFALASFAQVHPAFLNSVLISLMAALGAGLLVGGAPRIWTGAALVWLAAIWWLGQGLGGLGTGTATDLNLAPLVALLLVSAWLRPGPDLRFAVTGVRTASGEELRRKLALGGLAALVVGIVPALVGLPLAAVETSSRTTTTTSAAAAGRVPDGPQLVLPHQVAGGGAEYDPGR